MTFNRLAFVISVLIAAVVLSGQTSPQQQTPTFRASTDVVPLTVTVLDKKGAPVTDLKQSDFTVLEDDKPREIVNFFTQTFTPLPVVAAPATLNRSVRQPGLVPETRRTFLIILGYGRIQYPTKAVDGAMTFVRDRMLPQDIVAVMAFDRSTDFTGDRQQIARMIERFKRESERIEFEIDEFRKRNLRSEPLPRWIHEDIDAIFSGVPTPRVKTQGAPWSLDGRPDGSIRETAAMLLGADRAAAVLNEKPWDRMATTTQLRESGANGGRSLEEAIVSSSGLKIYAGIEYLRYLDGEKHILCLGTEPLGGSKEGDERLARRLGDARVTLNIVKTTGPARPPRGSLFDLMAILGFQRIAELSGGTYTGVAYATDALANVDRSSRFSYLLGYAPLNPSLDGRFRKVEVRINRPGLTVRYRHGYYAVDEPDAIDMQELIKTARLNAAAEFAGETKDIKVTAEAALMPRLGGTPQLRVNLTVDASRLAFVQADAGRAWQIQLRVYVGDSKEALIGDLDERLDIAGDEATMAQFLRDGIPYAARIPLTGTPKYVKLVVYDYGSDLLGTVVLTMKER